jgi:hypothetical protein
LSRLRKKISNRFWPPFRPGRPAQTETDVDIIKTLAYYKQGVFMVNHIGRTFLFGVILWISAFAISVIIFPVKQADAIFFETLITIALTGFTALYGYIFFKKERPTLKNALEAGIIWMLVNLAIDLPLFIFGPFKMPLVNYMTDIGLTYLIIPIILSIFSYQSKG